VVLAIDAELQEIAERGLDEALAAMKAEGGDVIFLDPTNGELLALASRQASSRGFGSIRASAFTDPFEPGSTAKLFTAAALLTHRRVGSSDAVFAAVAAAAWIGEGCAQDWPTRRRGVK